MIITCPACSARYKVAENAIPERGRKVKCAACSHQWLQMPDGSATATGAATATAASRAGGEIADAAASVPARAPAAAARKGFKFPSFKLPFLSGRAGKAGQPVAAHAAMRQKSHGRIKGTLRLAAGVSWGVVLAAAAGGMAVAIQHRTDIVRAWPNTASAFSLIGMPANLYGVDITGVQVASGVDATGPRIIVAGVLQSVSRTTEPVAWLRVSLVDGDGKEVGNWMVDPGVSELAPGAAHRFTTVRRNPPRGELKAVVAFGEPPRLAPKPAPETPAVSEGNADGLMGAAESHPDASLKAKVEGHGTAAR
jgi:predicted Zn finger-like uncharacterized protein